MESRQGVGRPSLGKSAFWTEKGKDGMVAWRMKNLGAQEAKPAAH